MVKCLTFDWLINFILKHFKFLLPPVQGEMYKKNIGINCKQLSTMGL